MLRSLWQRMVDRVYDAVQSVFRTQSEIDDYIEDELSAIGTIEYNPANLPANGTYRSREFWAIEDLNKYVTDAGIPPSCVFIVPFPDWDDEGNTMYRLYVLDETP